MILKQPLEDLNINQLANLYLETRDDLVLSQLSKQCEQYALFIRKKPKFMNIPEDEARAICPEAVYKTLEAFKRYIEQGTLNGTFRGLYARILTNSYYQWYRDNRQPLVPADELVAKVGPSRSPDPLEKMISEERVKILMECMSKLSEKERHVIQCKLAGFGLGDFQEIYSLKDALYHARKKMKECLRKKKFW